MSASKITANIFPTLSRTSARGSMESPCVLSTQNRITDVLAQPEQFCRVVISEVRSQGLVERRRVEERAGPFGIKGIIRGKHHAITSHRIERTVHWRCVIHSGERDPEIFLDVLRRRLRQVPAIGFRTAVKAPEQERQCLAKMAKHQFGLRIAMENATRNNAQRVRTGFHA